jgi:hypothetical protein
MNHLHYTFCMCVCTTDAVSKYKTADVYIFIGEADRQTAFNCMFRSVAVNCHFPVFLLVFVHLAPWRGIHSLSNTTQNVCIVSIQCLCALCNYDNKQLLFTNECHCQSSEHFSQQEQGYMFGPKCLANVRPKNKNKKGYFCRIMFQV